MGWRIGILTPTHLTLNGELGWNGESSQGKEQGRPPRPTPSHCHSWDGSNS